MTASIEDLIQTKWQEEYSPIIDGILFADGAIVLMEYVFGIDRFLIGVRVAGTTTLAAFLELAPTMWTGLGHYASTTSANGSTRVVCGGGGFGADGFVAVCDASPGGTIDRLRWLAFFQDSNPFRRVQLTDDAVIAESTAETVWTFPLASPERVTFARL